MLAALAIVALLAWARGEPGVDGRAPDPEDAAVVEQGPSEDGSTDMPVFGEVGAEREPRPPSLLDALAPIVVLVVLLALTIVLFGIDAAGGPLQVALMTSGVFAGSVAMKNGYDAERLREAAVGGVSSAMGAIFILLAVGALIGTWNMAGTIPTVVSYGVAILKPAIFFAAVAVICAAGGRGHRQLLDDRRHARRGVRRHGTGAGLSTSIAAGAVISGSYVGDKMSPLSETTILVPTLVGGVSVTEHIKGMVATVAPGVRGGAAHLPGHRPDRRRGRRPRQRGGGPPCDRRHLLDQPAQPAAHRRPRSSSPSGRSRRTSPSSWSRWARGCWPASPSRTSSTPSSAATPAGSARASRPSTRPWAPGSSRRAGTPPSTASSAVAAWPPCSRRSG